MERRYYLSQAAHVFPVLFSAGGYRPSLWAEGGFADELSCDRGLW